MAKTRFFVALSALLLAVGSIAAKGKTPLAYYAECKFGSPFQIVQVDRLPGAKSRPVNTKSGIQRVALLDGYRLLIAYDQTEPFANMKVEQLDPATYQKDKQALIETLGMAASEAKDMESETPKHEQIDKFDAYSISRKELTGGVLSVYTLFRDADTT